MFKVFKPKEVIDTNPNNINNNSNKNDILDDFNKYNSNFVGVNDNSNTNRNIINNNVLKNPSSNGVYFNNQNVRTIDLNDSMMRAQEINNQNNFRQDNVISNVEYNYNNELRKHNQLDNIKKIINDGTNTQNQNIGSGESNVMQNQMFNQGVMYNQQMNNAGMYNDNIQNQMPTQFQSGQPNPFNNTMPTIHSDNQEQEQNHQLLHGSNDGRLVKTEIFTSDEEGYRRCPRCGQKLRKDYKVCFVCGTWLD